MESLDLETVQDSLPGLETTQEESMDEETGKEGSFDSVHGEKTGLEVPLEVETE